MMQISNNIFSASKTADQAEKSRTGTTQNTTVIADADEILNISSASSAPDPPWRAKMPFGPVLGPSSHRRTKQLSVPPSQPILLDRIGRIRKVTA
jgi:hypothetical protein